MQLDYHAKHTCYKEKLSKAQLYYPTKHSCYKKRNKEKFEQSVAGSSYKAYLVKRKVEQCSRITIRSILATKKSKEEKVEQNVAVAEKADFL